jgi:hypothetical protein
MSGKWCLNRVRADFNYNQSQMQDVLNKMDEFLNAVRR